MPVRRAGRAASAANGRIYSDLPVQVYDWDGDGVNEVLYVRQAEYVGPIVFPIGEDVIRMRAKRYAGNATMVVLDGLTGRGSRWRSMTETETSWMRWRFRRLSAAAWIRDRSAGTHRAFTTATARMSMGTAGRKSCWRAGKACASTPTPGPYPPRCFITIPSTMACRPRPTEDRSFPEHPVPPPPRPTSSINCLRY